MLRAELGIALRALLGEVLGLPLGIEFDTTLRAILGDALGEGGLRGEEIGAALG